MHTFCMQNFEDENCITKFGERQSAKKDSPRTNYTMQINYQIKI